MKRGSLDRGSLAASLGLGGMTSSGTRLRKTRWMDGIDGLKPIGRRAEDVPEPKKVFLRDPINHILHSEDLSIGWAMIGNGTISPNSGAFFGTISYGTLDATSEGFGIKQTSQLSASNKSVIVSLYAQRESDENCLLSITVGSDVDESTKVCMATSGVQRFHLCKQFGETPGNVFFKIRVENPLDVVRVGGMMLEEVDPEHLKDFEQRYETLYIKTP